MWRYTFRTLLARRWRLTAISLAIVAGVGFIVGTDVLSRTLSDGVGDLVSDSLKGTDGVVRDSRAQESPFSSQPIRPTVSAEVLDLVQSVQGVRTAEGQIQVNPVLIDKLGERVETTFFPTYAYNWNEDPALRGGGVSSGRAPNGPDEIFLDSNTAEEFGFALGDKVMAQFKTASATFTLVGIGGVGDEANKTSGARILLLSTARLQELAGMVGQYNQIAIAAQPDVTQEELRDRIGVLLPDNLEAITGTDFLNENLAQFNRLIDLVDQLISAFGYLAIFVAAFVIYNIFSIVVAQRIRELGLLRAIGAGRRQILSTVLAEAIAVGALGAIIGIAVGLGLAAILTFFLGAIITLPDDTAALTSGSVITALMIGVGVTAVSAVIPAFRATRIPPIAALAETSTTKPHRPAVRTLFGSLFILAGVLMIWIGLTREGLSNRPQLVGGGAGLIFISIVIIGPVFSSAVVRTIGAPLPTLRGVAGNLARENGARNPRRTSATAAAVVIALSVVAMISVVANSFSTSVTSAYTQGIKADAVVSAGFASGTGLPPTVMAAVNATPGVSGSTAWRYGAGRILNSKEGRRVAEAKAADPSADVNDRGTVGLTGPAGEDGFFIGVDGVNFQEFLDLGSTDPSPLTAIPDFTVAITTDIARTNGWGLGDNVEVYTATAGTRTLPVSAIYERSFGEGLVINQTTFNALMPEILRVDAQLWVSFENGNDAATLQAVKSAIKPLAPGASVEDVGTFIAKQVDQFAGFVNVIYVLLALASVVSVIGIANTISLSVHERTREIGLVRAVGGLRAQIRSAVRWESAVISLLGSLLGVLLGTAFAAAFVKALDSQAITLHIPSTNLIIILAIGTVGGVLAAMWPARKAGQMDILTAIGNE